MNYRQSHRHGVRGEHDSIRARVMRAFRYAPTSTTSEWVAWLAATPIVVLLVVLLAASWLWIPAVLAAAFVLWRNRDKPRRWRRRSLALRRRADRARR